MKRKAEIQEAYNDAVEFFQKSNPLTDGNEVERCSGFQDALRWVLGRSIYRPYRKENKENDNDTLENRIWQS